MLAVGTRFIYWWRTRGAVAFSPPMHRTPRVARTRFISSPRAMSNTYGLGEIIELQVSYDIPVVVTGAPRAPANFGQSPAGGPEYFAYDRGSGSTDLVFTWMVSATDEDTNGLFLYGDQDSGDILLNGGTIQSPQGMSAAVQTTDRGTQSGHRVDGSLTLPENLLRWGAADRLLWGTDQVQWAA